MTKFSTIVADPPWPYRNVEGPRATKEHRPNSWDKTSASSASRYGSMTIPELKSLGVRDMAEKNAHLYLWTTNSFLVEAHELATAWGFEQKTMLTWAKMKPDGTPSMKTGYYYRGATEHCLFCVRGVLRLRGPAAPTVHLSQRLPHSVKPDWFYALVEQQSPGPYLEMFSRRPRLGWTAWGNEVPEQICINMATA